MLKELIPLWYDSLKVQKKKEMLVKNVKAFIDNLKRAKENKKAAEAEQKRELLKDFSSSKNDIAWSDMELILIEQ